MKENFMGQDCFYAMYAVAYANNVLRSMWIIDKKQLQPRFLKHVV